MTPGKDALKTQVQQALRGGRLEQARELVDHCLQLHGGFSVLMLALRVRLLQRDAKAAALLLKQVKPAQMAEVIAACPPEARDLLDLLLAPVAPHEAVVAPGPAPVAPPATPAPPVAKQPAAEPPATPPVADHRPPSHESLGRALDAARRGQDAEAAEAFAAAEAQALAALEEIAAGSATPELARFAGHVAAPLADPTRRCALLGPDAVLLAPRFDLALAWQDDAVLLLSPCTAGLPRRFPLPPPLAGLVAGLAGPEASPSWRLLLLAHVLRRGRLEAVGLALTEPEQALVQRVLRPFGRLDLRR